MVTADTIAFYQENGFVALPGFLSLAELEHWRRVTEEAVAQRLEQQNGITNQHDPESYYAQVFTQCLKLAETHPEMHALMHDPHLGETAARLAGVSGIRIWHDQALFKPPFGNPTSWHLDNPYWSFDSKDAISLWVALDNATLGNGCLWYLPGTHQLAEYETPGIGHNMTDLFKRYPEWRDIEPVAVPCPAGTAVFHNGLTAHGAGANMTNKPRRAMTCAYMPDGSTFNGKQNVLPDAYFASLKPGDLLDNDTVNPLIWKG